MKLNLRRRRDPSEPRPRRTRSQRDAHRKTVCEAVGGALLVVGFAALGLLVGPVLAVALGALAAGVILVAIGNV